MFKTWFLSKPPSISNGFRDICIFLYLGHDLDLFGSHHVLLLFDISNTLVVFLLTYLLTISLVLLF